MVRRGVAASAAAASTPGGAIAAITKRRNAAADQLMDGTATSSSGGSTVRALEDDHMGDTNFDTQEDTVVIESLESDSTTETVTGNTQVAEVVIVGMQ